jgi:hypothetical protein
MIFTELYPSFCRFHYGELTEQTSGRAVSANFLNSPVHGYSRAGRQHSGKPSRFLQDWFVMRIRFDRKSWLGRVGSNHHSPHEQ